MSYTPPIFATDSAALPTPLLVVPAGGSDGADARIIATDTSGRQKVLLYDSAGTPIVLVSGRVPVDGSGVTQPISAASLPLPTGASTAAKQPAIGVAGTPSADVISIQGETGMTPIAITGSITATNPSVGTDLTVAPTSDTLIGAKYTTARPTPTNGQMVALSADQFGNLLVALSSAMILPVRTVTAATDTATINDFTIQCDATSNNIAETLPTTLSSAQTALFIVKKVDSSTHTVTITNPLDGTTVVLTTQWQCVTVQWNGSAYRLLGDTFWNSKINVGGGVDIYTAAAATATVNSIRSAAGLAQMFIQSAAANPLNLQWDTGSGGVNFGNGAGAAVASVSGAGVGALTGLGLSGALTGTMGGFTNYTPTVTQNGAGGITGLAIQGAYFIRIGPLVYVEYQVSFTLNAVAGTGVNVSLPIASVGVAGDQVLSCVVNTGGGVLASNGAFFTGSSTAVTHNLQGGVTWPTGSTAILCSGFYRVA